MVTIFLLPWQRSKGVSWMNNWHISLHLSISLVTGKPDPQNRLKFYTDGGSYYQIITKKKLFTERGSYNQINKKGVYDIGFILNGGSPIQIIKIWHIQFQLVTISSFDVHSFSPIWNNFSGSYFRKRVQVTRRKPNKLWKLKLKMSYFDSPSIFKL